MSAQPIDSPATGSWAPPSVRWSCHDCFRSAVEYGYVAPGLALVQDGSRFLLLGGQGHFGEELVSFPLPPRPDPITPEVEAYAAAHDGQLPAGVMEDSELWQREAQQAMEPMASRLGLRAAWRLVNDLVIAGYDPDSDGLVELWIYNRCGQLIAERHNLEQH